MKNKVFDQTNSNFASRLLELRTKNGYTQGKLAELLGVHINSIQKYEATTRFPNGKTQSKMCELFGVSNNYLLGKTNQEIEANTSIDKLGLTTASIDTLKLLNVNLLLGDTLQTSASLELTALNILLQKGNRTILFELGRLLLISATFDKYYSKIPKYAKKEADTDFEAYDYYMYKLTKKIDKLIRQCANKSVTSLITSNNTKNVINVVLQSVNGLQDEIKTNYKDYLFTPVEKKILFDKE